MLTEKYEVNKETGCWEWKKARAGNNYGITSYKGQRIYAHRLFYKLFKGKIPDGLYVLHKCDNPCCVNPEHLFAGTQKDNMRDCVNKNRQVSGIKGKNHSEETKEKMKLGHALAGGRSGDRNGFFGKKHTPESLLKIKQASRSMDSTSSRFANHNHSQETKLKMSEAHKAAWAKRKAALNGQDTTA